MSLDALQGRLGNDAQASGDGIRCKLATGAAHLYASVAAQLRSSEALAKHVEAEAGMFSKADHAWLGRVDACHLYYEGLAEEHAAAERLADFEYGLQVARLGKAAKKMGKALSKAEAAGVPRAELQQVVDALARVQASEAHAAKENANVYLVRAPHRSQPSHSFFSWPRACF